LLAEMRRHNSPDMWKYLRVALPLVNHHRDTSHLTLRSRARISSRRRTNTRCDHDNLK
jgi:hypothetical protein